jgi:hypothetical protein
LVVSAIAFTWLFFVLRYLPILLSGLFYRSVPGLSRWLDAAYFVIFPLDLLFTRLVLYLALSVLGLAMAVAALVWGAPRRMGKIALLVGIVAIVAMPLAYRYQPAVWAEEGYVIRIPTQPGPLAGVVKAVRVGVEVRYCEHDLLGWHPAEGALYADEVCQGNWRIWVYRPGTDELMAVTAAPGNLVVETFSNLEGLHSVIPFDGSLEIVLREPVLVSPDGYWRAFVARHVYGPEDIIVVSTLPVDE